MIDASITKLLSTTDHLIMQGKLIEAVEDIDASLEQNQDPISSNILKIKKCELLIRQGYFENAYFIANHILLDAKELDLQAIVIQANLIKCTCLIKLNNIDLAKNIIDLTIEKLSSDSNKIDDQYQKLIVVAYLTKSIILAEQGEFKSGESYIDKAFESSQNIINESLIGNLYFQKAKMLRFQGKFKQALELFNKSNEIRNKTKISQDIAEVINEIGTINLIIGNIDEAISKYNESYEIRKQIGNIRDIGNSLNNIGNIYQMKGDLDEALNFYNESLTLREKVGYKQEIANCIGNMGNIHYFKGELDKALGYHEYSLELRENIGNKHDIAIALNNIGSIYHSKGEIFEALMYFQKSLKLREEIGNTQEISMSLLNIGEVYQDKGELDQALVYYFKCLEYREQIGNKVGLGEVLHNIGIVYNFKGQMLRSIDYLTQSLKYREEIGNKLDISKTLYKLIVTTTEVYQIKEAKYYFTKLEEIAKTTENKIIIILHKLASASILKKQHMETERAKSQQMFESIIKENVIIHEMKTNAMLNLIELLLGEYTISENVEIYDDVIKYTKELYDIAFKNNSFILMVEILILQSKLLLINDQMEASLELLKRAKEITTNKGLGFLDFRVSFEMMYIDTQYELITLNKDLKRSNNELSNFVSIVSHDLLQPLTLIYSSNELLTETLATKLNEKELEEFNIMKSYVIRMKEMINGLVEYSQVGFKIDSIIEINLVKIINDIIEHDFKDVNKDSIHIKSSSKNVIINGVRSHFYQIFQNL
ncbi:MAG: tetratricopeptide repeat protein, partial [Candidatus Heimdallarchaeota archaeon]|nr:tetratricopeptide repeat protein [Candidatus Heimdallarchaeota archaeon]